MEKKVIGIMIGSLRRDSFSKNSHEPPLATVNETVGRWQYFE